MPVECVIDLMKWQRLKDLTRSLSSSIEDEQIYAAQVREYEGPKVRGCLDKFVILSLIEHLKGCCLNRRMDTLMGLHMALNAWIMDSKNKREPIGAKNTLMKILKSLIKGKSALDDVALEAAMCLSFLDHENPIACEFLLQCLTQGDMKRKMKHRLEAIKLLKIFGLEKIQKLGMENEVFELLRWKVHEDPFQEVREAVAEVVEALKMKSMMLNIMES
ncbi:protein HEATR9 [Sarcophilus harrisii]